MRTYFSLRKLMRRVYQGTKSGPSEVRRRKTAAFRPVVETLEDRVTPSILFNPRYGNEAATNHGGLRLVNPPLYLIFWGSQWSTDPSLQSLRTQIQTAAANIVSSTFLSGLSQYGNGLGSANISTELVYTDSPQPQNNFTQQNVIDVAENANLPKPDDTPDQPIYFVFSPPGLDYVDHSAAGFHSIDTTYDPFWPFDPDDYYYALVTIHGSTPAEQLDSATYYFSHELTEAITDPRTTGDPNDAGITATPGPMFPNPPPNANEICDYEAQFYTAYLNGALVQSYWSQAQNQFLIPDAQYGTGQAVSVSWDGSGYTLAINGDQRGANYNDVIDINVGNTGHLLVTLNGQTAEFPAGEIHAIQVSPGGGQNSTTIETSAQNIPVTMNVRGNDTITGLNSHVTINQTGGTLTLTDPVTTAALTVSSGTLNVAANVTAASLNLSGGSVTGVGTLTVNGPLTWTGGTMSSSGGGQTVATGGLVISGANAKYLDGRTLINSATATWSGGQINTSEAALINNQGTFTISGGNLAISQSGTDAGFTNNGTLSIDSGHTLTISGGHFNPAMGTITGTVQLNSVTLGSGTLSTGAVVSMTGGSLSASATLVNQGTLVINPGTTTFSGAFTNAAGATLRVQAGTNYAAHATLTVAAGFTNAGLIDLTEIAQSQNYSNTATLTVTSGTLTNAAGGTIQTSAGAGGSRALTAQLDNQGTLTVAQALTLSKAGAMHVNEANGIINLAGGNLTINQSGTGASFTNNGTINIAASQTLTISGGTLTNFDPTSGTLLGGTYNVAGTFKFPSAALQINAAAITLDGSGAAQIIDQAGNNALAGFSTNTGSFTVQNGANFVTGGDFTNIGTLTIADAASAFTVSGNFTNFDGANLNGGTYDLLGIFQFTGANILINAATLILDGPGALIQDPATMNNGVANLAVNAAGASLTFQNGAGLTTAAGFENDGTLTIGTNSTLSVSGGYTDANTLNVLASGDVVLQSGGSASGTVSNAGTIEVSSGSTFTFSGGDFSNAGTVQVDDGAALAVSNGNFLNAGTVTIGNGSALSASANYTQTTGTTTLNGGSLTAGTITITTGTLSGFGSIIGNLVVADTLVVPNSTTLNVSGTIANSGTVSIGSGSILSGGSTYMQTAGTTTLNSSTLAATVTLNGGQLLGSGTIMGALVNAAEVDPGGVGAAGAITVTGNYTQAMNGVLNIEIGGYNAGTDFDQLNVLGNANLGGTLNVTLLNGFVPTNGDAFQVLTYQSRGMPVTNFSTMNLNEGGGITFMPNYDDVDMPGGLTLTANVGMDGAPAPGRGSADHREVAAAAAALSLTETDEALLAQAFADTGRHRGDHAGTDAFLKLLGDPG